MCWAVKGQHPRPPAASGPTPSAPEPAPKPNRTRGQHPPLRSPPASHHSLVQGDPGLVHQRPPNGHHRLCHLGVGVVRVPTPSSHTRITKHTHRRQRNTTPGGASQSSGGRTGGRQMRPAAAAAVAAAVVAVRSQGDEALVSHTSLFQGVLKSDRRALNARVVFF